MESKNSSSKKDGADAQLNGTQNMAGQLRLCAEISGFYFSRASSVGNVSYSNLGSDGELITFKLTKF